MCPGQPPHPQWCIRVPGLRSLCFPWGAPQGQHTRDLTPVGLWVGSGAVSTGGMGDSQEIPVAGRLRTKQKAPAQPCTHPAQRSSLLWTAAQGSHRESHASSACGGQARRDSPRSRELVSRPPGPCHGSAECCGPWALLLLLLSPFMHRKSLRCHSYTRPMCCELLGNARSHAGLQKEAKISNFHPILQEALSE